MRRPRFRLRAAAPPPSRDDAPSAFEEGRRAIVYMRDPELRKFLIIWTAAFTFLFITIAVAGVYFNDYASCLRQEQPRLNARAFYQQRARDFFSDAIDYRVEYHYQQRRGDTHAAALAKVKAQNAMSRGRFSLTLARHTVVPRCGHFPPPVR